MLAGRGVVLGGIITQSNTRNSSDPVCMLDKALVSDLLCWCYWAAPVQSRQRQAGVA